MITESESLNKGILPRAAVVQDISGFGRVSLTEALPVMSAMGVEVCPLPTALLSTHTYEFKNYTLLDLTDEMKKIINHWDEIGVEFDAVYSGYMSSAKQIEITKEFMQKQKAKGAIIVVDPVMGDNALLDVKTVYSDRMYELIDGMRDMCSVADAITPNLTEACLLLDYDYPKDAIDEGQICDLLKRLSNLGPEIVAITSVKDAESSMCVAVYDRAEDLYFKVDCGYVERLFHGTGDIYASVFTGALMQKMSVKDAANIAAEFVRESIAKTVEHDSMPVRHGTLFETVLREGFFARENYINRVEILKQEKGESK